MKKSNTRYSFLISFIPIIVFLCLWELISEKNIISNKILPSPLLLFKEFLLFLPSKLFWENFIPTLIRVITGFTTGALAGIMIGSLLGLNYLLDITFSPFITLLYPIPALGWLPILMILVGINNLLPILIIFICSFFPITYNTKFGIQNVNKNYIKIAKLLGASNFKIFFKIIFPLALGNIFTGLRLEAGMAWRVIIAAEMIAIPTGLGALMLRAENLIRMDIIIITLFVLSFMTLIFERFFLYLEKKSMRWKANA